MAFRINVGTLTVTVGADTTDLPRAEEEVKKTTKKMGKSFSALKKIVAGALSLEAVRRTLLLADQMNMLDARIRALTKSAKGFRDIREGIRGVAKETGGSIASITELAQRALIAQDALGATNTQIIDMVNNVQKLGVIGGGSQASLTRASIQLGQALSQPRIQAEELNSILEQMPLLAKEIEKNLGLFPGSLKQAVVQGKVLNTDIFQAIIKSTDDINTRFEKLPLTIDRASGMIVNAFASAVQEIDNGFTITENIAESMKDISELIENDLVPIIDDLVLEFVELAMLWDEMTKDAQDVTDETFNWAASLGLVKDAVIFIFNAIKNLPVNLRDLATIITGEVSQAFINLGAGINKIWLNISAGFSDAMVAAVSKVKSTFFEFIGTAQRGFSEIFKFLGAEKLAESFANAANQSKQTASDLTTFTEEELIKRQAQLEAEIEAINANTEVKLLASQMAIEAGLAETDEVKKQTQERIKQLRAEIKARREKQKGTEKTNKEETDDNKSNLDKQNFDLDDAQKTTSNLEKAGIVDSKIAASAQIGISASKAIAKTSELGFPAAIPFIAEALATIAIARKQLSGAGRQFGGTATRGLPIPVNEGGPELFVNNAGRQFLLPDRSGSIMPLNAANDNTNLSVVINNNSNAIVSEPMVTQGQMMIEINDAVDRAVNQVNSSLASGRGETAESLRNGFQQTRNIR